MPFKTSGSGAEPQSCQSEYSLYQTVKIPIHGEPRQFHAMDIEIKKMQEEHINKVTAIHIASFPNFFLSFLGERFLKEFYRSFLYDKTGLALVAETNGKLAGFAVGTDSPAGYFKRLLIRRWWVFSVNSINAILRKPWIIPRLFRAVFYRGTPPGQQCALLSSIAVAPKYQGCGIGKLLIKLWIQKISYRNIISCYLTTDAENNCRINAFYQSQGWKLDFIYQTAEGRKMNRYIYEIKKKHLQKKK
ncbi:MAG: GNAT family N-acetyltransferase [Chitinivibrionales bacterium]|nr:GNAT family N-acetyltransferase [Chitinivibrionales bacterium]